MSKKRRIGISLFLAVFVCSIFAGIVAKEAKADAPLQATDFILNGEYSIDTNILNETDEHWYKVTIPDDGALEVKIMSYCSGNLNFSLYNEDLSQKYKFTDCNDYVSGGTETSPVTVTATNILSKGIYYFQITGTTGRYKMCGSFAAYGVNDLGANSYDSPFVYTLGTTVTGALTKTDTEDWYKFVITTDGFYDLKIMSYSKDYIDFKVSNEDLSVESLSDSVSAGADTSPATYTKQLSLTAGTYYTKIYDAQGKYVFSLAAASGTDSQTTQSGQTKSKISKLSVTAKRGKKSFTVKTIPYATLKIKYKGKTWSAVSSGYNGKVKLYNGKKLKRGAKIKVTVAKYGYKTKTKTFKVK